MWLLERVAREYVLDRSPTRIAAGLNRDGILTPGGCKIWRPQTVYQLVTTKHGRQVVEALEAKPRPA